MHPIIAICCGLHGCNTGKRVPQNLAKWVSLLSIDFAAQLGDWIFLHSVGFLLVKAINPFFNCNLLVHKTVKLCTHVLTRLNYCHDNKIGHTK